MTRQPISSLAPPAGELPRTTRPQDWGIGHPTHGERTAPHRGCLDRVARPLRWLGGGARKVALCALLTTLMCSRAAAGPARFGDGNVAIQLEAGTNLIAIPVTPTETSAAVVLGPLGGNLTGAHTLVLDEPDPGWLSYSPQVPLFLNTLDLIEAGQALALYVNEPATLEIGGEPIDSLEVQVEPGWNLIGYSGVSSRLAEEVFAQAGVSANIESVWTLVSGQWLSYVPGEPDSLDMDPGRGYWILATEAAEWFFDGVQYHVRSSRADLLVEDIWVDPNDPLEGEPVTVYARIRNAGYQPALNVTVNFYKKDPDSSEFASIGQGSTTMIAGGGSVDVDVYDAEGLLYQTVVLAIVDEGEPAGSIPELNEKNNRRAEEIHVRMPDPALSASELPISPYLPYTDSTVTLTADVTNQGDADASDFTLRFSVEDDEGTVLWSTDVVFGPGGEPAIPPGATRTCQGVAHLYTMGPGGGPVTPGYYRFVAEVDPDPDGQHPNGLLKEIDENNNVQSRPVELPDPPDITLESSTYCCWGSPNGPKEGDHVRVGITIRNVGASAATDIKVTFEDTSDPNQQWSPDGLNPGSEVLIEEIPVGGYSSTFNWLESVPAGDHDIQLTVEYGSDGRTEILLLPTLSVRSPLPDLWLSQIRVNHRYPTTNKTPRFYIDVKNIGETSLQDVDVGLYYTQAEPPWTEENLDLIAVGNDPGTLAVDESTTIAISWDSPLVGEYTVVAWADHPTQQHDEVFENNNQYSQAVFIRNAGPDLWPWAVKAEPRSPIVDEESQLKCLVFNAGDQEAAFTTTFYHDGDELGSAEATVHPSQKVAVSIDWTPEETGPYEISAVADPGNAVVESLEDNNERLSIVWVRQRPHSIKITAEGKYADHGDNQYSSDIDGNHGKAWCLAYSLEGCGWQTCHSMFGDYPCFKGCDFQERAAIRVAVYKTFEVTGPSGSSARADVTLDTKIIGVIDTLFCSLAGSAYWSVKEVVGITKGDMYTSPSGKLNNPMRSKVLIDEDSGSLLEYVLETAVLAILTAPLPPGVTDVIDAFIVDAVVYGEETTTLEDVTLEAGEEYTVFVYVDLETTAVGLSSQSYADFYFHSPHNDQFAKQVLPDRGVWLNAVEVEFK